MLSLKHIKRFFIIIFSVIISTQISCEDILKLDMIGDRNIIIDTTRWQTNNIIETVELIDNFKLEIYQSEKSALHVEADSNLMANIKTTFNRRTLTISRLSNYNIQPSKNIIVRLYINNLYNINVSNRGSVLCDTLDFARMSINVLGKSSFNSNNIVVNEMIIKAESGATVDLNGDFSKVELTQLGSGETTISGNAENLTLIQEGSGKVEALDLKAVNADITLTGSGLIYCYVTDFLNVDIKGSGRVYYKGTPNLMQTIDGNGGVGVYY